MAKVLYVEGDSALASDVLGMPDVWTLRIEDRLVELTSIESKLLTLLFQAQGAPVSRKLLCEAVWKIDASRHWKRLYVHLTNLRTKFGSDHEWRLQAVKGGGYRLAAERAPPKMRE
jgi:DNA-binding response OmpR family regulator